MLKAMLPQPPMFFDFMSRKFGNTMELVLTGVMVMRFYINLFGGPLAATLPAWDAGTSRPLLFYAGCACLSCAA